MDNQTYQQIIGEISTLITILSPLALAIYGVYKTKLHKYIEAKISSIQNEDLRKVAENTLSRVEGLTTSTITMLEATLKPTIIENIKNGTMTKDNLLDLKQTAIDTIKNQLTKDGVSDLQNTVGDVNSYLNTLIEAKLADLKVDTNSSVAKTEISMPTAFELDISSLNTQLNQVNMDKENLSQINSALQLSVDSLTQQLSQVQNDKATIEQANSQLLADKQALQSKLDSITNTLSQVVQPIATVTDNSVQIQAGISESTVTL